VVEGEQKPEVQRSSR